MSRLAVVALSAALFACSNGPPSQPPLLVTGTGQGGQSCALGNTCRAGSYCLADEGTACSLLECPDAGSWVCVPDGGLQLEASTPPSDASTDEASLPPRDAGLQ